MLNATGQITNTILTLSAGLFRNAALSIIVIGLLFTAQITQADETTLIDVNPQLLTQLTEAEKQYLHQHDTITVQNETDFAPFNFVDKGQPTGYSIDIIKQVGKQLGLKVQFIQNKSWDQYLRMLQQNKIDAMINVAPSRQRSRYALFTSAYAQISVMAVTRKGDTHLSQSEALIAQQRIAIVENYAGGAILKGKFPDAEFVIFKSPELALKAVASYKADIFFGNGVMANYYIEKHFISGLAFSAAIDSLNLSELYLSIATHKSRPILASLLQKSVEAIPEHIKIQLRKKWRANSIPNPPKVQLTNQEREYLDTLSKIRIGSGIDYPPHTYKVKGVEQGYSIDLVKLLADMLNIELEFVESSWSEHLSTIRNQQNKIDVLLDVASATSRRKYLIYTQPYHEMRSVVVMPKGQLIIKASYEDLAGLKVAVLPDWPMTQQLSRYVPDISLYEVQTPLEALQAVSQGHAQAFVTTISSSHYLIRQHKIPGLQLIPWQSRAWEVAGTHAFALSHNNQLLRTILDKALLAVPQSQWQKLQEKWFGNIQLKSNNTENLSKRQKRWLLEHPNINIYLPSFGLPIGESTTQGYVGILADFIDYLDQRLTTSWLPQNRINKSYTVATQADADLTIGHINDPILSQNFLFTKSIIDMPVVILTANPTRFYVDNLSQLEHSIAGVMEYSPYINSLQSQYPALKVQPFKTIKKAILAVNSQDIDVLLCPLLQCAYIMDELGTNKIRTIGQTEFVDSLRFAVREDWPELVQIINTELQSMSGQFKNNTYRRWNTRQDVIVKVDYSIAKYLLLAIAFIGTFVLLWNRNIAQHAAQTQKYAQSIEKAHEELKQAQSQLVHAEKMASIGTLTAGIAHEINNPANFIRVGLHNLKSEVEQVQQYIFDLAGEDAEQELIDSLNQQFNPLFEHLDTIREGTERIMVIVQDLTAFSRPDNALEKSLDLADCIATTVNLVRTQYVDVADITTQIHDLPKNPNLPTQLNQVILNLIINAGDAIKEKQSRLPKAQLGHINICCKADSKFIKVIIQDDGCGMSEQTKNKLFEPFYTTKGVGKGTGLGMSVSFGIIHKHGGKFEVESTLGEGSKITIKLPIKPLKAV